MRQWADKYYLNSEKAQATLELAIFGAILIMLLGILINYGLRYVFQQQAMQQSFRKALAAATTQMSSGTPISTSHMVVNDRHVPSPSDTFGVGSVMPMTSGASVTRSYKLQETPDTVSELPHTIITIQGHNYSFKTAGFVDIGSVSKASFERYQEIYGATNVDDVGGWAEDGSSGPIRIIDPCAGELISYDVAVRQCRQIVDSAACTEECERGEGKNCSSVCSQPIQIPWYCQNYVEVDPSTHRYKFGVLDQLFASAPGENKAMGLQDSYTQTSTANNRLIKQESSTGVTSTDRLNWGAHTERTIIYKPYGSTSTATVKQEVPSDVSQDKTKTWRSNW